ncbi:MAG: iron-regulated protein [Cytophagales bacterium]|nr:MAG: iron-regulated protein [Cytophagales bacterium]
MQKIIFFIFLLLLVSCDDKTQEISLLKVEVLNNYSQIAYQNYQDAYLQAQVLQREISNFLANPSDSSYENTKKAWLLARSVYGQTEVFRFYGSPIDDPKANLEPQINAWPLDESYIDYVEGNPKSGIINDLSIVIDKETLRKKNEQDGVEENVSIGYHAIEFLLWGQDLSKENAGKRSYTDYTKATNADRRGQYLLLCTELLVEDLQKIVGEWDASKDANYRANFMKNPDESLANILTGMGSLSRAELGGERMRVALVNHDQEDETSCFSDNTHNDILANVQGMINIYHGKYKSVQGKGLADLIERIDKTVNEQMKNNLAATLAAVSTFQPPFDREISGDNPEGNTRIQQAIRALDTQTVAIEQIAKLLNVGINTKGS